MTAKSLGSPKQPGCAVTIVSNGDACDKTAVGMIRYVDERGESDAAPACAWHLNYFHTQAVPLHELPDFVVTP